MALVVVLNTLIAAINFYIAWRVWKIRRTLAGVTKGIIAAERNTYNVLHPAPQAIYVGQKGTGALRKQYRQLEIQLERLEQILALLRLGVGVWGRRSAVSSLSIRKRQRQRN